MKCWNAVAKVADRMLSRLGHLSFLSLMILSLALGQPAIAADDADEFKLWQRTSIEGKFEPLKHLNEEGTKKAVRWTVTEPSSENFKKFVTTWAKEPFQFVEGFKAGMLKAIADKKLDSFLETAKKEFAKLDPKDFGGFLRHGAFKDLLAKLAEMKKEDLEDEDFLRKLFDDPSILAALQLTAEDPNADEKPEEEKPEEDEEEKPGDENKNDKPTPSLDEQVNDQNKNAQQEQDGQEQGPPAKDVGAQNNGEVELLRNQLAQMQQALQNLSLQRAGAVTGEVNDAALQRQAQLICDKFNALEEGLNDNFNNALRPLQDGLNDVFNRLAAASRIPELQQNRGQQLEDILPGLLANALNEDEEQQVQPPTPPQAAVPPSAPVEDRNESSPFDQLPPPPQPEEEPLPPQGPAFIPPPRQSNFEPRITLDLPSTSGRQELRDAEDVLSQIQNRTPVVATLGPAPQLPELVMAKARLQGESSRAQAALENAKWKADQIEEQLEQLKEGGRAALSPSVKRQEAHLQNEVKRAQRELENFQQQAQAMAQQPGVNPQAIQGQMQNLQQQLTQAEENLNRFQAEKEIKIEEGDKRVKSLAKQRDRLRAVVSKLEGEVGTIKEEEQAMQQMINQNMQLQMQAIQGPVQTGLTPNVNRIQQFGNSTGGAPRTQIPGRVGGLGAATQSTQGATVPAGLKRGSLGAN